MEDNLSNSYLRTKVSKHLSYLLRHNPEGLKMDQEGFVDLDSVIRHIGKRFQVDRELVYEIVNMSRRKRFEIIGNKIRALYGHTLPAEIDLEEDNLVKKLYHGTTIDAASKILKIGLKPMKRRFVHLSINFRIATEVGLRRTFHPVILEIDVLEARKEGIKFFKATKETYLCEYVPSKYIRLASCTWA